MDSNKIRSFQPGDEEEIVRVFEAAFGEADYYFPRSVSSWVWRYMQRPGFDPKSVLMIRKKGTVVATLSMTYGTMVVNNEPKKVALIDDVSSLPQWRKQGLATALMTRAIARAEEVGCWGVHLSADPEGDAIRIYKNVGFETITHCTNMLSVLKHRRAARFGKRQQAAPLLALSLLDFLRNIRIDRSFCRIEIVDVNAACEVASCAQDSFKLHNGTLVLDKEYVNWMANQRPDGELKLATISREDDFSGIFTVSSSDFSGPGGIDRIAIIGNLITDLQAEEEIAAALYGAKNLAKNALDCPMVSIFVDQRDTTMKQACKKAGFMEIGKSASMFHPLNQSEKLNEIREGIWNQPVETTSSNP
ncbi:MAG: GNAT family N-acetyltransferase [Candidatus Thorarchaeota archaeon]